MRETSMARPQPGERYRRSPALMLYWPPSGPACFDCQTAQRSAVTPDVFTLLCEMGEWTGAADLARAHDELGALDDIETLLDALATRGLLQRESTTAGEWAWNAWTPEAAFFHFATRNRSYGIAPADVERQLRAKAIDDPPPLPTKSIDGKRARLKPKRLRATLQPALIARRTWRRFGSSAVPRTALATLLQLTWGVQRWGFVEGQGRVALKTSPSGGARHAIEAYVIVRHVQGISKGVYHFDAATSEIVRVAPHVSTPTLQRALANQRYFMRAGAIVVMSAIFARAMWRYPYSRAYRSILTEAGHLGQTFCLIATALNLAPFCTMAFRDSEIESLIGADGINEAALYVVGVGTRPKGRVDNPGKPARESVRAVRRKP